MATPVELNQEIRRLTALASEVCRYGKRSWSILAHKPRLFLVCQKAERGDSNEDPATAWLYLWTHFDFPDIPLSAGYSSKPITDYNKHACGAGNPFPNRIVYYTYPLNHTDNLMAFLTKIFGKNLTAGYDSLRMGLKALFEHIQSECRQCAEDFASGEATQRWHEYEREFVKRMNNQRAIEIMSEVLDSFKSSLRIAAIWSSSVKALEKLDLIRQATKDRKLFVE